MIHPHPNQTESDLHKRAATLRAAAYCCEWCKQPRNTPLAVEVYQDAYGEIVLCGRCALIYRMIAFLHPLIKRFYRGNR
jgi:hypothetical protein